jgi:hypothetical protein
VVLNADICILPLVTPVLEHGEVSVFKSPLCKRKLCNAVQSVLSGDLAQPTRIYFLHWNVVRDKYKILGIGLGAFGLVRRLVAIELVG